MCYSAKEQSQRQGYRQHQYLFLAMLVTCNTTYKEAIPFFYSAAFFAISDITKASNWLYAIGPDQVDVLEMLVTGRWLEAELVCFAEAQSQGIGQFAVFRKVVQVSWRRCRS
ncbi:hypothetical protein BDV26DRAFT_289247 [Aspergillus bertholletiae]|uniref:DUF7730 domain-containing protein n=1 Tax=Aspergillus bertholletiae TaxID=1226010 RepID=A0A5N7BIN3_9EURO|nr:hypothetical protein BDV26DRAFT_289247 [Aspergillus bertholletiae]